MTFAFEVGKGDEEKMDFFVPFSYPFSAFGGREREVGQLQSLAPRRRGRKPHPLEAENALLKKQLARTEKKLEEAEIILDAQKKLCQLFGMNPLPEVEEYLSSQSSKKPPEG